MEKRSIGISHVDHKGRQFGTKISRRTIGLQLVQVLIELQSFTFEIELKVRRTFLFVETQHHQMQRLKSNEIQVIGSASRFTWLRIASDQRCAFVSIDRQRHALINVRKMSLSSKLTIGRNESVNGGGDGINNVLYINSLLSLRRLVTYSSD